MKLSRRTLVGAGALAALPLPAFGQEKVVRFGISMADVPLTTGQPDRGAGAYKFTGHTLYDPLIAWEMDISDKPGKLIPGLATSWTIEPNGESFRVKLRDAQFHNGFGPVRAEDVKFGYEQIILPDSVHGQQPYFKQNVKSVEVVGEKEMLWHMNKPDGIFLTAISEYQGGVEVSFELQGFSREMVVTAQGLIVLFSGAMATVSAPLFARVYAKIQGGH